MGTRGKSRASKQQPKEAQSRQPQEQSGASAPAASPSAQPSSSDAQSATPDAIKKGLYLSALIYIEGYRAPADDFIAPTTTALKKVLGDCLAGSHDGLTMSLKSVDVRNDVEQDDSESSEAGQEDGGQTAKGKKQKEEKFQF